MGKELNHGDLANITQKLDGINLTPMTATPLYGMVLPDGVALNLGQIEKLVDRKEPNLSNHLETKISKVEVSGIESEDLEVML